MSANYIFIYTVHLGLHNLEKLEQDVIQIFVKGCMHNSHMTYTDALIYIYNINYIPKPNLIVNR